METNQWVGKKQNQEQNTKSKWEANHTLLADELVTNATVSPQTS